MLGEAASKAVLPLAKEMPSNRIKTQNEFRVRYVNSLRYFGGDRQYIAIQ